MTLEDKLTNYYWRQLEEHYAPFIKTVLSKLLSLSLKERPHNIKVVKNKKMKTAVIEGEPETIKYHIIDLGLEYRATLIPEMDLIEIAKRTFTKDDKEDFRVFLSFSIQKELFSELTPIKKATIEDADRIEKFTTFLRELNL